MKVRFEPNNVEINFKDEISLMQAADMASVAIDKNCAGLGTCGKCKVKILSGNVRTKDPHNIISDKEKQMGYVLACCTDLVEDTVVEINDSTEAVARKTRLITMPDDFVYKMETYKKHFSFDKSRFYKNSSIQKFLLDESCGAEYISPEILNKAVSILNASEEITITASANEIINIEAGDTSNHLYGLAIDIGTTTGVVMFWDLNTGKIVGSRAFTNPQANYGADVISRINFINQSYENLELLNSMVISSINREIDDIVKEKNVSKDDICKVVLVGNTTMCHILAKIDPFTLALSPFIPVYEGEILRSAEEFGIDINKKAKVLMIPNIAEHVGADITAGVITTDMPSSEDINLFIDIGTNGEIVLSGKNRMLSCSTAAGPAFEGTNITWGMRAAAGAIEDFYIDEKDVIIKTIDNKSPIGICGSGIIDAIGELVRVGIVNRMGKLLDSEKMIEKGLSPEIASRIKKGKKGNYFVITKTEDNREIYISQKDVREVQVAKAAILTGANLLMNELGVSKDNINSLKIAGAFGNYIKKRSAINAGVIPDIDEDKIVYLGNSAGIGASMILLSEDKHNLCNEIIKNFEHIELATRDDFQNEYLKAMSF